MVGTNPLLQGQRILERFFCGLASAVCFLGGIFMGMLSSAQSVGQGTEDRPLPVTRVVLFSSGVGYFEHGGTIEGNREIEFRFRTEAINDLLKSLVIEDLDGGQITSVSYTSKDPITKTLKSFAVDLTEPSSVAQLLLQLRGQRVEIEAPQPISGAIVSTEEVQEKYEMGIVTKVRLNLMTDEGLRTVPLESVSRIRFCDPVVDRDFRRALEVLAGAHDVTKKVVSISLRGEGRRRIRLGYILEAPIWKTSYRLVLDEGERGLLQGWAIVENTTDEDWRDVRLALVSGRPISFTMNLYEPLYIRRPEEKLELYESIRGQAYEQALEVRKAGELAEAGLQAAPPAPMGLGGFGGGRALAERQKRRAADESLEAEARLGLEIDALGRSVRSAAEAVDLGQFFRYEIAFPVRIDRQQSAMLPIVVAEVPCRRLSIYNETVHSKYPLAGLRLKNDTNTYWTQGPITVFEGGAYAGDAKITDIPPGSERLISYAVDLQTEVAWQAASAPDELLSVRLARGVLISMRKAVRSRQYTLKYSGEGRRHVLIDYPIDPNWTLVEPKEAEEKTRSHYRFGVDVSSEEPTRLEVREEQIRSQQVALTDLNEGMVAIYLSAKQVSEPVKQALREVMRRNHEIALVQQERVVCETKIREIFEDQERIRANMGQLDRASELYKNYVKKFTDQETEIEKLRARVAELKDREAQLQKARDEYLMALEVQ